MSEHDPAGSEWWSVPGPDYCEFCRHRFHVEIGHHCADCDRPVCPLCVTIVRSRQAVVCPECSARGGG